MGDKIKKTIKEIELRSLAVAVFCIAIVFIIASQIQLPGSSAWNPNPTSIDLTTPYTLQPATDIIFSDPIQLTGNPDDPWEEYGLKFSELYEYPTDMQGDYVLFFTAALEEYHERLFLFNLKSNLAEEIYLPGLGVLENGHVARIWGDNVVISFNGNILLYNIPAKRMSSITDDVVTEVFDWPNSKADIYKNLVVWSRREPREPEEPTPPRQIWFYDINNGQKGILYPDERNQFQPKIFGTNVVWYEFTPQGYPLFWYDMKNQVRTQLCSDSCRVAGYDIYKNEIVWGDVAGEETSFYKYDISQGHSVLLDEDPHRDNTAWNLGIWEHLFINQEYTNYPSGQDSLELINTTNNQKYILDNGYQFADIEIDGPESAFIYPGPPYHFNIVFSQMKPGTNHRSNLYLIKGQII